MLVCKTRRACDDGNKSEVLEVVFIVDPIKIAPPMIVMIRPMKLLRFISCEGLTPEFNMVICSSPNIVPLFWPNLISKAFLELFADSLILILLLG